MERILPACQRRNRPTIVDPSSTKGVKLFIGSRNEAVPVRSASLDKSACAVATALCAVRNCGPKKQTAHRGVATTFAILP
jgi:hypothetical protein